MLLFTKKKKLLQLYCHTDYSCEVEGLPYRLDAKMKRKGNAQIEAVKQTFEQPVSKNYILS